MKKLYAYKIVVCIDYEIEPEYYTDRGIVFAEDMTEGLEKVICPFKNATREKIVTFELDELETKDTIVNDCFSVYEFLANLSMFTDITHEIKGWSLIKE